MRMGKNVKRQIRKRLGHFPGFLAPARSSAPVLEGLWQQMLSACLDNPLPATLRVGSGSVQG